MSTVRQKVTQVNKEAWKAEEEKTHGNKQIIDENANIDIEKIAKEADKEAEKVLKKVVSKVKKTKSKKTKSKKS